MGCPGLDGAARWRSPAYLATPHKHKMTRGRHRLIWQPCLLRNQLVPARGASSPLLRAMSINGSGQPGRTRPQINFSRTPNNLACSGIGRRGGRPSSFLPSSLIVNHRPLQPLHIPDFLRATRPRRRAPALEGGGGREGGYKKRELDLTLLSSLLPSS